MCGIFGIIGRYDEPLARRSLESLRPRGMDAVHFESGAGYCFGHTRLAIMDTALDVGVSKAGDARLVFNGEIYNYRLLGDELGLSQPFCESDVILAGLMRHGKAFLRRLQGMYAISFWDGRRLLLARDPIGKKPLFYSIQDNSIIFASELKAILPHKQNLSISMEGMNGFFGFLSPLAPYTIYEGIYKLAAGELLEFEGDKYTIGRFDTPLSPISSLHADMLRQNTVELLTKSVSDRLSADVEVGSLLSGGLDSAIVLALATKLRGKGIRTFTVGYDGFEAYDERAAARESAEHFGSRHTEFVMGKGDFFASLERYLEYMDEPLNDPAALPLDFMMRGIKDAGVKCVLSGEGSDEQYYGYRKYMEYEKFEAMKSAPYKTWLRNHLEANIAYNKEWEWYLRAAKDEPVYRGYGENFLDSQRDRLLTHNSVPSMKLLESIFAEFDGGDYWRWASFVDLRTWLDEALLHKVDRVSMANGVEVRAPFLDIEFVKHSFSIPSEQRRPTSPKSYLKEAFADILPPFIIERDKKGFSYPYMEWLREHGELDVIRRVAQRSGLFDMRNIEFYMKPRKDKGFKHHLWALYIFSRWHEKRFL